MIHLYLSLAEGDLEGHDIVGDILTLNAGIGLVQAAGGDDETARRVADAHIAACEGLVAVISGTPDWNQIREIRSAAAGRIPIWLLSDGATVDLVEDHPVRCFHREGFIEFVDQLDQDWSRS